MIDAVKMIQLVQELPTRVRGRACIVLTHEYESQEAWATELARQTSSDHVNLLELFAKDDPALLFVMQHDKAIVTRRFRQHSFVVDQRETMAL